MMAPRSPVRSMRPGGMPRLGGLPLPGLGTGNNSGSGSNLVRVGSFGGPRSGAGMVTDEIPVAPVKMDLNSEFSGGTPVPNSTPVAAGSTGAAPAPVKPAGAPKSPRVPKPIRAMSGPTYEPGRDGRGGERVINTMHKGGDVKEDGLYRLKRGEKVLPPPKKGAGRDSPYRRVWLGLQKKTQEEKKKEGKD